MNRSFSLGMLLLCVASLCAAAEESFGNDLVLDEVTSIADILARPHDFEGKAVRVEGSVTAVCQSMGCWLRVGSADGAILLAKSSGDRVTIPTDAAGRRVIVEGMVVVEHGDGDDPEPHDDAEGAHSCPTDEVRLETRGVRLL